jgi:phage baseplate assembly protein W
VISYNITFPFKDDNTTNGFLAMNQVTKDAYTSNLFLLLLTEKNQRYYESDYGTNLLKYIFEPNDNLTASQIEEEIKNTVTQYIPQLKITSVTFNWNVDAQGNPISENQVNVNVNFVYTDSTFSETGNININF